MRIRSDGEQTRRRIMEAARKVFAQKGFRDATHEMICGEAGANKAAINYHFGDKRSLYRAVWQHLLDDSDRDHPVTGMLPDRATAEERLEAHIQALLNRHFGQAASWELQRLRDLERVNPTGLVGDILQTHHEHNREQMLNVLRDLLGHDAPTPAIHFYETSALGLCRGGWASTTPHGAIPAEKRTMCSGEIDLLARQVTHFVLAGIASRVHLLGQEVQR